MPDRGATCIFNAWDSMTSKYANYLHTILVVSPIRSFIFDSYKPVVSCFMVHWGPDSIPQQLLHLPLSQVGHGQTTTLPCARILQPTLKRHWRSMSLLWCSISFPRASECSSKHTPAVQRSPRGQFTTWHHHNNNNRYIYIYTYICPYKSHVLKYAHLYSVLFVNPESRPNFLLSHMASAWCFGDIVCHDLRRGNEIRKRFENIKRTIAGFVAVAAAAAAAAAAVVVVVVVAVFDS